MNTFSCLKEGTKLSALSLLCFLPKAASSTERPNILYIMTDQQCVNMISALGMQSAAYVKTPNLDRLVRSGYSFTRTYAANPLSVPSRFSLLTGQSPAQFGVRTNDVVLSNGPAIEPYIEQYAMGNVFKKAGYQTYYGGKVHLPFANGNKQVDDTKGYGFTYIKDNSRLPLAEAGAKFIKNYKASDPLLLFLSFINPHDICTESWQTVRNTAPKSGVMAEDAGMGKRKNDVLEALKPIRQEYQNLGIEAFETDRLSDLPQNLAGTKNCRLGTFLAGLTKDVSLAEWRRYRWVYFRLVEKVDAEIGLVLDALDKSPLKKNTIVIFTSDHGEMAGSHGMRGKNFPFEECQRVPFVFAGKGVVKGREDAALVCNGYDLLPTMCDMAGIPWEKGRVTTEELSKGQVPSELLLNGMSLWAAVSGQERMTHRPYLFLESAHSFQIVTDGGSKLVYCDLSPVGPEYFFTDLLNDPYEKVSEYGNPVYSERVKECDQLLLRSMQERGLKPGSTSAQRPEKVKSGKKMKKKRPESIILRE